METGTQVAGVLLPFFVHRLYTWVQSPASEGDKERPAHDLLQAEDLEPELEDEPFEGTLREDQPVCLARSGSAVQQRVFELSYQDDSFILGVLVLLAFLPWVSGRLILRVLRWCLPPLKTARRNVVIKSARAGDSSFAASQPGRRKSH